MSDRLPAAPALLLLACLLALPACRSTYVSGNALHITEVTKEPYDLTLTVTIGLTAKVSGMQVQTVGDDTVVTRLDDNRARRFILRGLTGYRGRIYLKAVDIVVGGTSVWIDETSFKAHGPDGSVDIRLRAPDGDDPFDGRDLIFEDGRLTPVGGDGESGSGSGSGN